jgi:hypothetical protein
LTAKQHQGTEEGHENEAREYLLRLSSDKEEESGSCEEEIQRSHREEVFGYGM